MRITIKPEIKTAVHFVLYFIETLFVLCCIGTFNSPAVASDRGVYQGQGRDTGGAIRLIRAGDMVIEGSQGKRVTFFQDDVKIIQDSLTIWCDEARHFEIDKILRLQGNVILMDPSRRLDAEIVTYDIGKKKTIAQGNVRVWRDSVELSSRQGKYEEVRGEIKIRKDITLVDHQRNIVLTGDFGFWNLKENHGLVTMNPVLTRTDSSGLQTKITADTLQYDAEKGVAIASDNVKIAREEIHGFSDHLFYYPEPSKAMLIGDPRIIHHRDEASGDSIWLYFSEQEIDSVEIFGKAKALTPADSSDEAPRNVIKGFRILMDFENRRVARLESRGQATGLYHLFEEGKDKGSNLVSGDRLVLWMKNGELEEITVEGGTQGTFYPPKMAGRVRTNE